ncbi:glycosyltransferase family 4 protein [Nocardioides sp. TRM66260-LWL]|uniref:glycosyltransferase family 4 protein n=1 Tax=Nocardioides sp. TRM66260-LWL TaxID=2874478 RepID=UPI001CC67495|nr:glycosyltransferase family 4 protein [Nocardioides sp. TRM66260-LWL]MBZ5735047.1 glycosyltransferase family 4 protein [Nocardioides sp. TRM66260-LWL]
MRIVHVTDTYLPRVGGIELHVADLAARQSADGADVTVVTARTPGTDARPHRSPEGVRIVPVPSVPGALGVDRRLRRVLADLDADVVHGHLSVASPFAWAGLRQARRPRVATLHSMLPAHAGLVRAGLRVAVPAGEVAFTAVSRVAADRLAAALPEGVEVGVLHNGIDADRWRLTHRPTGRFEILVVGRLAARKRTLVVVGALARLRDLAPDLDWHATIVGDGPQRARVVDAVRRHRLERHVHLPGALSREQIRDHLARADAFVAAATLESFGIAALEARCAGVPVVAMAAGGVTEFVRDGVEGLLARDDAHLAPTLLRLAQDPALAARIRRHNAEVATGMEWTSVLREHRELYARVRADHLSGALQ